MATTLNQTNTSTSLSRSRSLRQQKNHRQPFDSLRLHYVTQRILASILPKRERDEVKFYGEIKDTYEKEINSMLEQKHGKKYRVFDLESCLSVITLERICELCKHIDSWLGDDQERVVVLQDREDRQRLRVAIAAYLEYLSICSSNFSLGSRDRTTDRDGSPLVCSFFLIFFLCHLEGNSKIISLIMALCCSELNGIDSDLDLISFQ